MICFCGWGSRSKGRGDATGWRHRPKTGTRVGGFMCHCLVTGTPLSEAQWLSVPTIRWDGFQFHDVISTTMAMRTRTDPWDGASRKWWSEHPGEACLPWDFKNVFIFKRKDKASITHGHSLVPFQLRSWPEFPRNSAWLKSRGPATAFVNLREAEHRTMHSTEIPGVQLEKSPFFKLLVIKEPCLQAEEALLKGLSPAESAPTKKLKQLWAQYSQYAGSRGQELHASYGHCSSGPAQRPAQRGHSICSSQDDRSDKGEKKPIFEFTPSARGNWYQKKPESQETGSVNPWWYYLSISPTCLAMKK